MDNDGMHRTGGCSALALLVMLVACGDSDAADASLDATGPDGTGDTGADAPSPDSSAPDATMDAMAPDASVDAALADGSGDAAPADGGVDGCVTGALTLSPESHVFAHCGAAAPDLTFTVTYNWSAGPLSSSFGGSGASDFTLVADTCGGAPLSGSPCSCTAVVRFDPTMAGVSEASFDMTNGTAAATARLIGVRDMPYLVASPPGPISFSPATPTSTVAFTNVGCTSTDVPSVALTGAGSTHFSLVSDGCTAPLAAGASCDVEISFEPTSTSPTSARLEVTLPGTTATVELTGTP